MKCTTIASEQVWQSADGQRTIWDVTLKAAEDSKEYKLKTYSKTIGTVGWEGEARSYINPRGERFARIVGDDKTDSNNTHGSGGRDDAAIKAQWAIGQAVALFNTTNENTVLHEGDEATRMIQETATVLFNMVTKVKGEQ